MRLLLDANLSWRLVRLLQSDFSEIKHIATADITEFAADTEIWDYAKQNQFSIVTNDDDFYLLSLSNGFPPKIILLRTGNQSTQYIAVMLRKHKTDIEHFLRNADYGVLEIY